MTTTATLNLLVRRFVASNGETFEVRSLRRTARNEFGLLGGTDTFRTFAVGMTSGLEVDVEAGCAYQAAGAVEEALAR